MTYFATPRPFEYDGESDIAASACNSDGWVSLGDIGRLDDEGYLYLTDHKAFAIISGRVNVYPQEVENLLIIHPSVADVAVVGAPNEDFGEEVKAVVQPADWADAGPTLADELIAFCREQLSKQKCPRSIVLTLNCRDRRPASSTSARSAITIGPRPPHDQMKFGKIKLAVDQPLGRREPSVRGDSRGSYDV